MAATIKVGQADAAGKHKVTVDGVLIGTVRKIEERHDVMANDGGRNYSVGSTRRTVWQADAAGIASRSCLGRWSLRRDAVAALVRTAKAAADEAARHAEYERTTVADMVNGQPVTVAELRQVMDAVQDKDHWKNPLAAWVDYKLVPFVLAAIRFYHGTAGVIAGGPRPLDGWVLVESPGYACE